MKPHDTFLELAAISIDFPLTSADRGRLEQHLTTCAACGRTAHELRGDAMAFSHLPPITLPERRGAEILAAAMHPPVVRNPVRLLVVVALLGLLLLGSLAVGSELLRRMDEDNLGVVLPVPTASASPEAGPSGSPDASPAVVSPSDTLVVTRGEGDARAIEILTPDGRTTKLAAGWDPAWLSSDTIIYTCLYPDGQPGICSVKLDVLAEPQSLIAGADRPALAPDGRSVAIHRGMIDVGETWIMSADGSNPRLLRSGWFPQWSPDGAWLAGQPEGAAAQVAIVGADGQGFRVLAPGYDPAWSPTGQHIAFAVVEGDVASLRTVDVSSGAVEILHTAPAGEEVSAPVYLAEGRIAFVQDGNVWIFDSSGARAIMSGHAIEGSPSGDPLAVSPDGSRIAFTHGAGTEAIVEIREINGGNEVYPANGSGPVTQPAWVPAGRPSQPSDGTPTGTASPGATPAVGGGGQLGDSWVAAQMPVAVGRPVGRIEAVTAGGPGFVAVGRGCVGATPTCEGVVWTSTDGKAWLRTPAGDPTDTGAYFSTSGGPEIGMFDVAAGDPGIVAIGYAARPDLAATIWFSSDDGASWERARIGDVGSTRVNAITWDGRQFVMVGEDRSQWDGTLKGMAKATARAAVWTSPDGRTWTRAPHTAALDVGEFQDTMEDPSTGGMNDVVAGPAGLVAVGSVCTAEPGGCKAAAWTSPDGSSWEREVAMRAPGDVAFSSGLNGVAASDSGYIAVSDDTVVMSADGRSWERRAQMGRLSEVVTIGTRFFGTVQGDGWQEIVVFDSEGKLSFVDVGDPLPGSVYNPAEWHLAATSDIAVAVGPAVGTDDPMAMVSVGKTAP
jgi:hypothetical protein